MIKKEEYIDFIRDLYYFCQAQDAKERTYRESFERHPNDFIKFGTIQNSMGKSDAYQKIFYRIKKFIEEGVNDVECYSEQIGRTIERH